MLKTWSAWVLALLSAATLVLGGCAANGLSQPVNIGALLHNPYTLFYRAPFGAVTVGTAVRLRLRSAADNISSAAVELFNVGGVTGADVFLPMHPSHADTKGTASGVGSTGNKEAFWSVTVPPSDIARAGVLWYRFRVQNRSGAVYYGPNGASYSGTKVGSFQLTVYVPGFTTPSWLQNAVIYEIFPDRFYDGNIALNENPTTQWWAATQPGTPAPIYFHQNWNGIPCNPAVKVVPSSANAALEQKLHCTVGSSNDFFGGNLPGITAKLDYLKSLGVTALYMTPIFQASSNHKYDTGNFKAIDPGFGTLGAFEQLVERAQQLGIHLILDGAFEDTGANSLYMNRYGTYPGVGAWQQHLNSASTSPFYNWYQWTPGGKLPYAAWHGDAPLALTNPLSRSWQQFVFGQSDPADPTDPNANSVARYWLAMGASGWRLDSADTIPLSSGFWQGFRQAVLATDPQAAIIGEIWPNATNDHGTDWLTGTTFDSVMNYQFLFAVTGFFGGVYRDGAIQPSPESSSQFNNALMALYSDYPLPAFYSMMNLVDSQDTERILNVVEGAPSKQTAFAQATWKPSPGEQAVGLERLQLVSDFQFAFPGAPAVYYGDEAGMGGYGPPYNRETYPWGAANQTLLTHYRLLGSLRDAAPVLRTGSFVPLFAQGETYAFARVIQNGINGLGQRIPVGETANQFAVEALNDGAAPRTFKVPVGAAGIPDGTSLYDVLSGGTALTVQAETISLTLGPYSGALLLSRLAAPIAYEDTATGGAALRWIPFPGATAYEVQQESVGGWQALGSPTMADSFSILDILGENPLTLRVVPIVGGGPDLAEASLPVDVPAVSVAAPAVVADTAGTGVVTVTWSSVAFANTYTVYRTDTAGSYVPVSTVAAPCSPCRITVTGLDPSRSYRFRVAASNVDSYAPSPPVHMSGP